MKFRLSITLSQTFGTYRYLCLLFDLTYAPGTFQRLIDHFRRGLDDVLEGVPVNLEKTLALFNFPRPRNIKDIQSCLQTSSWYRSL